MSLVLNATASDPNANSYLDVDSANELAVLTIEGDLFKEIPDAEKATYLMKATVMIEGYMRNSVTDDKAVENQKLLFPIGEDTEVPQAVKLACIAQASYMFQNRTGYYQAMNDAGVYNPIGEFAFKAPSMISRSARNHLKAFYKIKVGF